MLIRDSIAILQQLSVNVHARTALDNEERHEIIPQVTSSLVGNTKMKSIYLPTRERSNVEYYFCKLRNEH
jgi:hypothetical protein